MPKKAKRGATKAKSGEIDLAEVEEQLSRLCRGLVTVEATEGSLRLVDRGSHTRVLLSVLATKPKGFLPAELRGEECALQTTQCVFIPGQHGIPTPFAVPVREAAKKRGYTALLPPMNGHCPIDCWAAIGLRRLPKSEKGKLFVRFGPVQPLDTERQVVVHPSLNDPSYDAAVEPEW